MNCVSNDVACVVRSTCAATCYRFVLGACITLTERLETEAGPAWFYQGDRVHCPRCTGEFTHFLDADLQPIRGRGMKHYSENSEPIDVNEIAHG